MSQVRTYARIIRAYHAHTPHRPIFCSKSVLVVGSLTGRLSYVFGYALKALREAGYKENENLVAAPYDWRIPPSKLEERDGFLTECKNNVRPLLLLCGIAQ